MDDTTKPEFTFAQLANFAAYEKVRSRGLYNMFFPEARSATGLDRDAYTFVMKNYTELRAAAEADSDADYNFTCYSCSHEWERQCSESDCPECGTTNTACAINPR